MLLTRLMWPLVICISSTRWTPRLPSLVFFLYTAIAYPHSHAHSPTSKFDDLSSWDREWQLSLFGQDTPWLTLQTYVRSKASCLNTTDNFIHPNFAAQMGLKPAKLECPRKIWNVDNTKNKAGVMFLPWTALNCLLTGYDYGLDCIISHGLLSRGVISHVQ